MDSPQTYRRLQMPVEMIELEEVMMVETSDESLEALVGGIYTMFWSETSCGC